MKEFNDENEDGGNLLSDVDGGTMASILPIPCIIEEIIYPPVDKENIPPTVRSYIEAAINSHN